MVGFRIRVDILLKVMHEVAHFLCFGSRKVSSVLNLANHRNSPD